MSAGLFGLLDDVAALARLAAASIDDIGAAAGRATAKAAGVVIDDTAVTPQYVHGIAAERELPIIKRIAIGSLRNKLLFILPAALAAQPVRAVAADADPDGRRDLPLLRGRREGVGPDSRGQMHHAAPTAAVGEDAETPDDCRRDPDRLHPVRRDHGDRTQRGGRPVVLCRG